MTVSLAFTDDAGAPVDPSDISLVIKDSLGTTKATKTETCCPAAGDLTKDSVGHYHYHYDTASTDVTGYWRAECTAIIATLHEVAVSRFYVSPAGGTAYFGIIAEDITEGVGPDTDMEDCQIEKMAGDLEKSVMNRLQLTSAPTDEFDKADLKHAIVLLTAAGIESREPHSEAVGSYRWDKFSRVLWRSEAEEIIRRFEYYFERT
jgi:hypothetical protein